MNPTAKPAPARDQGSYSPERTRAILEATVELLSEVGYDSFTMDLLATRARASKATIYRRWQDKRELVIAALQYRASVQPALSPDTGNVHDDLLEMCRFHRQLMSVSERGDSRIFMG